MHTQNVEYTNVSLLVSAQSLDHTVTTEPFRYLRNLPFQKPNHPLSSGVKVHKSRTKICVLQYWTFSGRLGSGSTPYCVTPDY